MTLDEFLRRPDWMQHAACRGVDPEFFFPERGGAWHHIKAVCDTCPVTTECLEYGLWERDGVWGGKSGKERRALRRGLPQPRPRPPCGTYAGCAAHYRAGEVPCQPCKTANALRQAESKERRRGAA